MKTINSSTPYLNQTNMNRGCMIWQREKRKQEKQDKQTKLYKSKMCINFRTFVSEFQLYQNNLCLGSDTFVLLYQSNLKGYCDTDAVYIAQIKNYSKYKHKTANS